MLLNPWLTWDDFGITAFPSIHAATTVAAEKQQSDSAANRDRRMVRYFHKYTSFSLSVLGQAS